MIFKESDYMKKIEKYEITVEEFDEIKNTIESMRCSLDKERVRLSEIPDNQKSQSEILESNMVEYLHKLSYDLLIKF